MAKGKRQSDKNTSELLKDLPEGVLEFVDGDPELLKMDGASFVLQGSDPRP